MTCSGAPVGGGQDRLRRGDAVLFALRDEAVQPGDVVAWAGRRFVVVSSVGMEFIAGEPVYPEVGLRRLGVEARGCATGRVGP